MHIYFGNLKSEDFPDLFEDENGETFEFVLDMNVDASGGDLTIEDSIGRFVPIDLETVPALINALTVAMHYAQRAHAAVEMLDTVLHGERSV
jgi:hypothetical protein